jgi:hypothetical protein
VDAELRQIERQQDGSDQQAANLLAARVRAGVLHDSRVWIAAALGEPAALVCAPQAAVTLTPESLARLVAVLSTSVGFVWSTSVLALSAQFVEHEASTAFHTLIEAAQNIATSPLTQINPMAERSGLVVAYHIAVVAFERVLGVVNQSKWTADSTLVRRVVESHRRIVMYRAISTLHHNIQIGMIQKFLTAAQQLHAADYEFVQRAALMLAEVVLRAGVDTT